MKIVIVSQGCDTIGRGCNGAWTKAVQKESLSFCIAFDHALLQPRHIVPRPCERSAGMEI